MVHTRVASCIVLVIVEETFATNARKRKCFERKMAMAAKDCPLLPTLSKISMIAKLPKYPARPKISTIIIIVLIRNGSR